MKRLLFFLLSLVMVSNAAFAQGGESVTEPALAITTQPVAISIAQKDQSVTLSFVATKGENAISYQWYKTTENKNSGGTEIPGATSADYTTETFPEKEIRYYYCVATVGEESVTSNVAVVAYTGLPIVKIETVGGVTPKPDKEKVNGRMYIIKNDEVIYDSGEANEFKINVRGNATAYYPKRPYKLKLPKKANLLSDNPLKADDNKDKNWVLLSGYCDKTLLRTKIGFYVASLFNGVPDNEQLYVPHSEFVDVILNGEYIGNYCLTDAVKEGDDRVDVNLTSDDEGGIGFVSELDQNYYKNEPKWFKSNLKQFAYTFKFPDTDDENFDSYMAYFEDNINQFEEALYGNHPENDWRDYIDVESFARTFLVHNILANLDVNYFFSKKTSDNTSRLTMGPVWDFEWSIGIGWYDGERPRPANYWCIGGWYFDELFKKSEFFDAVQNQWAALNATYPDLAATINAKMDEMAADINISQQINFKRWNIMNSRVSVGGIPLGSYEAELECDKQFMVNHIAWLDEAINRLILPDFSTLTVQTEKTYDGTDAAVYSGTITIGNPSAITEGDDVSIKISSVKFSSSSTTTKTLVVKYSLDGNDKAKYSLKSTSKEYTATITPAVVISGALTTTTDENGTVAEIDGDCGKPLAIAKGFHANSVTYKRSFKGNTTSTVMLPFEASTSGISGKFYTMKSITPDESNVWTIDTDDAPSTLSANTPYLFNPSADITEITFENVELYAMADGSTTFGDKDEWAFQGVYTLKEWEKRTSTDYGFAANKSTNKEGQEIEAGQFVRAGDNSRIKPTRAYLTYDNSKTLSKSATTLPDKIIVLFPDETEDEEIVIPVAENDDFLTPISEVVPNAGVKVWSYEKTIFIEGREGMEYSIVDMGGRRMMQTTTKSDREEIHLNGNPNGIMIVRIAGQSFKVMY